MGKFEIFFNNWTSKASILKSLQYKAFGHRLQTDVFLHKFGDYIWQLVFNLTIDNGNSAILKKIVFLKPFLGQYKFETSEASVNLCIKWNLNIFLITIIIPFHFVFP